MKFLMLALLTINIAYPKANSDLLKCLGHEELLLHKKKDISYNYKLNQEMISAMVQLHEGVALKKEYFRPICADDKKASAFELLRTIMVHKQKAFSVTLSPHNKFYNVAKKSIDELYLRSCQVFVDYLAAIRAGAPTVNCITDHIPGLTDFYQKLLYLQEDLDTKTIINSISDMNSVFIKLEYVDSIYKKCQQEAKKPQKVQEGPATSPVGNGG